uniref:Protein-tyrosine phosphatase n=1 Tax=Bursaphelenchus xylophilus TaxID=6326 RepID=A0A1I7RR96_BURXY
MKRIDLQLLKSSRKRAVVQFAMNSRQSKHGTSKEEGRAISKEERPTLTPMETDLPEVSKVVMRRFANTIVSKGVDGLLREYSELKLACPGPDSVPRTSFLKNPEKNRYKDIPCIEDTRVNLKWPPGTTENYIHANWVRGLPGLTDPKTGAEKMMICTQGPTKETVPDFWRMVWQEKIKAIVMLCSVVENGKKKCEQYWPEKRGDSMALPFCTVTNRGYDRIGLRKDREKDLLYTTLIVKAKGSDGTDKSHYVNHVLWSGWPDKAVPLTASGALALIMKTWTYSPAVVHCSAGVGRTGTIVALEACLRQLLSGEELSVYNIVKNLRNRRYLACQTDLQYLYIHMGLLTYITSKNVSPFFF